VLFLLTFKRDDRVLLPSRRVGANVYPASRPGAGGLVGRPAAAQVDFQNPGPSRSKDAPAGMAGEAVEGLKFPTVSMDYREGDEASPVGGGAVRVGAPGTEAPENGGSYPPTGDAPESGAGVGVAGLAASSAPAAMGIGGAGATAGAASAISASSPGMSPASAVMKGAAPPKTPTELSLQEQAILANIQVCELFRVDPLRLQV
jgi:hypothetical protein